LAKISAILLPALVLGACSGSGPQSALEPAGKIANDINNLWLAVFWVATAVFVIVEVALVYAIWKFRERKDDDRRPKQLHGNTAMEITWTIIPAVILAVLTVPMLQGLFEMREVPTGDDVLHINVTGHQWWWEFEYVDETAPDGRTLVTANELHIPADTDVYLTMTSTDVIHSFWIPKLNGKRDVVPGRVTNLNLRSDTIEEMRAAGEAEYDGAIVLLGQCAEFCGLAHPDMRVRAFVHDADGYAEWVAGQLEPNQAFGAGWDTFSAVCTACHQVTVDEGGEATTVGPDRWIEVDGIRFRSSLAPNLSHFGARTTFGSGTFANDTEHLSQWIDNPSDLKPMDPDRNIIRSADEIEAGERDRILGMPDFGLDEEEIANVVALLQSWQ
jgi:cytochrome c oxidase subunit 2